MAEPTDDIPPPPEGFRPSARGPYTTHNGPIFHKPGEHGGHHAFHVLHRHCNGMGILHGGMIATFMDGVLARAVGSATGGMSVTVHLSMDYLSMARAGDWVFGEGWVTRHARDLMFVEGRIWVGTRDVARASAVFKPVKRKSD